MIGISAPTQGGRPIDLAGHFRLATGVRVVRRAADEIQLGTEPPRWRILRHAPAEAAEVLARMDGSTSAAEVLGGVSADPPVWLRLLTDLRDAGLLVPDAGPVAHSVHRRRRDAVVEVRGPGPLACSIAELLAASGIGRVCQRADIDPATLVVLAGSAPAPPEELAELVAGGRPHLAVNASLKTVVLGPFVLPGLSTCLLCILRHRNDVDGGWPAVEAGLRADPVGSPAATRALAAAGAVAEALRAVDGLSTPDTLDATMEWRAGALTPRRRSFTLHPECECTAIGRRPARQPPRPAVGGRQ